MRQGYIKLYRQLLDNPLWLEKPFSKGQAWADLLLTANYTDNKIIRGNQILTVPRGCVVTSESYLMSRWGWSKSKVRGFLELLELLDMISKKTDRQKTTIILRNYCDFQESETTDRPQKDHGQTTKRPPIDRNKEGKKNNKAKNMPPYSPPTGDEAEESIASSSESLTVEMAGGAAETADHSKTWMDESFNRFWTAYPRKVAKQEARKAWDKLKPDEALLSKVLRALEAQKRSDQWKRDEGRYIPHAATWLRGERWEDDTAPPEISHRQSYAGYDLDLARRMIEMENDG